MFGEIAYSLTQTSPPAVEPITLAQAKNHCRIETDFTEDDSLLTAMIVAARQYVEQVTNRQLITATWVLRLDSFPADEIEMPYPQLLTVTSVAYVNTSGVSTTLTVTTDYTLDIYSTPGRVMPAYGCAWPSTYGYKNDVTITYTAGYGAAASAIPAPIVQAVYLIVGHLYENREQFITDGSVAELPTVMRLLQPYRVWHEL